MSEGNYAIKSLYNQTYAGVKLNGHISNWFETYTGVGQGDALSPTLFNIFINDLSNELNSLNLGVKIGDVLLCHLLYADDLTLIADNEGQLQLLLDCVHKWCEKWRMNINCLKSNVVHFRKTRSAKSKSKYSFKLGDMCLNTVERYKYLGLIFDEYLTFDLEVNDLCLKGGRALAACISRFKDLKDVGFITFTKLYNRMVNPVCDYFSALWGHTSFQELEKLQNRAIRYFLGLGPRTPILAMQGEMGWLSPTARHSLSIIQLWNKLVQLDHARLPYIVFSWMSTTNGGWFRRRTDLFKIYDLHCYIVNKEVIPLSIAINKITLFENNKWNTSMQLKPKLRTYITFKTIYATEMYVKSLFSKAKRSILCQLRCGVLPLAIETGRYANTPVDQRLCRLCNLNQIEDESHFVCQCTLYKRMRTELYLHISSIYPTNFILLTPNEQLKVLMSE